MMGLTGRLAPGFRTIADFRRDNGAAIRHVCRRFIERGRELNLLFTDMVRQLATANASTRPGQDAAE
jgi:transposase